MAKISNRIIVGASACLTAFGAVAEQATIDGSEMVKHLPGLQYLASEMGGKYSHLSDDLKQMQFTPINLQTRHDLPQMCFDQDKNGQADIRKNVDGFGTNLWDKKQYAARFAFSIDGTTQIIDQRHKPNTGNNVRDIESFEKGIVDYLKTQENALVAMKASENDAALYLIAKYNGQTFVAKNTPPEIYNKMHDMDLVLCPTTPAP